LLWEEIARINSGEADESRLKSLMIILDQMDEEFEKGRD
jgi:hypothetical protein